MEQLWEAIDEEVLAGAVLVPLLPDPASKFASSGNVNPTAGALYSGMYICLFLSFRYAEGSILIIKYIITYH